MRSYAIRTKVVIAVASAMGLLAAMGEPWYGPRPVPAADTRIDLTGTVDAGAQTLMRWFREPLGASAWQAFEVADVVLATVALSAGIAAVACLHPEVQQSARLVLQLSAMAALGVLATRFVDQPGDNAAVEPRYGLFVALALVVSLLVSASGINACALRRRRSARLSRGYGVR